MQTDARGVFSGFIIAPAVAAFAAVAGMLAELYLTAPEAADLTVGEIAPLAGALWFSGLMFAYPAAIGFVVIWLALRAIGLGSLALWLGGAIAGFSAMAAYLMRITEAPMLNALAGGQDVASLTMAQLPSAFALPTIGAVAGIVGALTFAAFAKR